MKININPIEIIKLYTTNKYNEQEDIKAYIEKTALEASSIADIWEKVVTELNMRNQISSGLVDEIRREIETKYLRCNHRQYTRLMHFYSLTSRAIGDKVNEYWLNTIIYSLGDILSHRNLTKSKFEEIVNTRLSNVDEIQTKIDDLFIIVDNLRDRAEFLYVLAQNIKLEKIR